ncbi:MAG: AsmA-like C-terminal domain-containing protein [Desulfohalobiaceae bacterium]
MSIWLRWTNIGLCQALALAFYLGLIVLLALPACLDSQQLKQSLQQNLSSAYGISLEIGNLELAYRPQPVLQLQRTSLRLPQQDLELQLPRTSLQLGLWDLLQGRLKISQAKLEHPSLSLNTPPGPDVQLELVEHKFQEYLSLLPPGMQIQISQGRVHIQQGPDQEYSLQDLQLQASLEQDLELQLMARGPFFRELDLELQLDPQDLQANGNLQLQDFKLKLQELPFRLPELELLQQLEAGTMELDFQLHGLQQARGQLRFQDLQAELLRANSDLKLRDLQLETGWSWEQGRASLELQSLRLPQAELRLTGSAFWEPGRHDLGFDLQGSLQDVAHIRGLCLSLWPENQVLGHVFRILRQGEIPEFKAQARGSSKDQILSSLEVHSQLQAGRVRIREADDLKLEQVSGSFTLQDKSLLGQELQASALGSKSLDGELELGLNERIEPFKLQADLQADLSRLPQVLMRYLPSPALERELKRMQDIKGQARARLGLSQAHKDASMQMEIQASDIQLQGEYSRLPAPLHIQGQGFSFQGQAINLQDLKLGMGSSSAKLQEANIDWSQNLNLELQSQDVQLELQELMPWLREQEWAASSLPAWELSQGRVKLQELTLQGQPQEPEDWDYAARGQADDLLLRSAELPWRIRILEAGFDLDPQSLDLKSSRLLCGDSALQLKGSLQGSLPQEISLLDMQLKGSLGRQASHFIFESLDLPRDLRPQIPMQVSNASLRWQPQGPFELQADLLGPGQEDLVLDIRHQAEQENRIQARIQDSYSQASLEFSRQQDRIGLKFQGHLQGASLDGLLLHNRLLQGELQGELELLLQQPGPSLEKAAGDLHIQGLNLPWPRGGHAVSLSRLRLLQQGDQLQLKDCELDFLGDSLELEGHLIPGRGDILELELGAEQIHWPRWRQALEPVLAAQEKSRAGQQLQDYLQGLIRLRIQELILDEYRLQPFFADYYLQPEKLRLQLRKAGLCGIQMQGELSRPKAKDYALKLDMQAKDLELKQVLDCLGLQGARLDGKMQLEAEFDSQAQELGSLKDGLQGELQFTASQGRIRRMQLLAQIISILNTTEVFFGTELDLEHQGLAYNQIQFHTQLEDSKLQIQKGHLNGETLEMAYSGKVHLDQETLDMIFLVAPLKTVDRLVKKLPVFSHILGGNLVVVPIRVTGDLQQPRITPMSPKAVSQTLLDILTRGLLIPAELLQPLMQENQQPETQK